MCIKTDFDDLNRMFLDFESCSSSNVNCYFLMETMMKESCNVELSSFLFCGIRQMAPLKCGYTHSSRLQPSIDCQLQNVIK